MASLPIFSRSLTNTLHNFFVIALNAVWKPPQGPLQLQRSGFCTQGFHTKRCEQKVAIGLLVDFCNEGQGISGIHLEKRLCRRFLLCGRLDRL